MHFPPRSIVLRIYYGRPVVKQQRDYFFSQFDFSPSSVMNGTFEMVGGLKPASKSSIDMGRVFSVLQFVHMCDYSNGFFFNDLTRIRGSETKTKGKRVPKVDYTKKKQIIRFDTIIEFGGWEEVVHYFCLNCCSHFLFLFLVFPVFVCLFG